MRSLTQALRTLIQDPSSNFAATGTAIAIVVLAVIILVLLLIAAVVPSRRDSHPASDATPGRRRLSRLGAWGVGMLIVAIGAIISDAAWYQITSPTEYCTSTCHAMAKPAATWAESAHTSVPCIRCHEGEKWSSFPVGVASRARSMYYQITGVKARRRIVPAEICLSCHIGLLDTRMTARNGEGFYHRQLIGKRTDCSGCHGAQGHVPLK
jgi:hypothetical protein